MKKNKDLKKIYDGIFKKGETKHFTKNLERPHAIPADEREALSVLSWKGKRVLDVGCGTGLFAHEAAKRGASVLGVDYSQDGVRAAKRLHSHKNLEFRCEDILKSSALKEKFDVVVSLGTLEHMDDPYAALVAFKRLLKPGGSIVLTCPNWVNPRGLVLMTLQKLFDAPVTLADIHYFSPKTFHGFAKRLGMDLEWYTFDRERAAGNNLTKDFGKRLPNVLRDAKLRTQKGGVEALLAWLDDEALAFEWSGDHIGATGIYHLRRR